MSRAATSSPATGRGGAFFTKLRDRFIARWVKPSDAAKTLSHLAAEKRERDRLTEKERRDALHARLFAERETPMWRVWAGQR